MLDIKRGATFEGGSGYIGVPFMVVGFALGIYAALREPLALLVAVPVFALGLVIFMVRKGTRIDPMKKRFQPYRDLLLLRIGPWIPLDGITAVRVKRERETYSHNPGGAGIMQNSTSFWCFNVTLHGSGLFTVLFLKEYYEAAPALGLGKELADALGVSLIDETAAPAPRSRSRR